MAGDEDFINGECMDLKLFLLHNPDNDNMATFTQKIEGYIESYHSWAIAYLQTSSGSPNTETIHAYRRKIAVLHEFLDLHRQGHDAFALASAWGKTVYSGRRYVLHCSPLILSLTFSQVSKRRSSKRCTAFDHICMYENLFTLLEYDVCIVPSSICTYTTIKAGELAI